MYNIYHKYNFIVCKAIKNILDKHQRHSLSNKIWQTSQETERGKEIFARRVSEYLGGVFASNHKN